MERAGKAAYYHMIKNWSKAQKIIVVCGSGNNGGDGYALSKYAFLGIGLHGDSLLSNAKDIISIINSTSKAVLAIDCPSGINTDTGTPIELAVYADATITFIGIKQGLITGEARDYCGKLFCHDLNLPIEVFSSINSECNFYDISDLKSLLPPRKQTTHKNDNGHVLVIGGNFCFAGVARMAAEGALRCGAGLVSVATRKEHVNGIIATRPEIMVHGVTNQR